MNIFVIDPCPVKCATYLDDKRVVKMILETAQLLSTAINQCGGDGFYKSTHVNHPCTVWVRQSKANYQWLVEYFVALCDQYTLRYNKIHKCFQYIDQIRDGVYYLPDGDLTSFANCAANSSLGISYKHLDNVFDAYKLYLNDRWDTDKREPTWKNLLLGLKIA